jgi:CubicO group peptidase (beta-lactamase class C family)
VRDLLGHTAGLGDPPETFFERLGPRSIPTARQHIAATPKPGPRTTDAEYSNTGFMIAGLILERAAGQPVAALMRRELFAHPGGDGLAFQPAEHPHRPLAHAYWYPDGGAEAVDGTGTDTLLPYRGEATMASTAGALAGDVPSLARWAHEPFSGRILQPGSLKEMTKFHDGLAEGYGLGVARSSEGERELWGHTGKGLGNATELWHLPREHLTIAITCNDDLTGPEQGFVSGLLRVALGSNQSAGGAQ